MSSPIQFQTVSQVFKEILCAACTIRGQSKSTSLGDAQVEDHWGYPALKCRSCGQCYVLCDQCNRLTSASDQECDHCAHRRPYRVVASSPIVSVEMRYQYDSRVVSGKLTAQQACEEDRRIEYMVRTAIRAQYHELRFRVNLRLLLPSPKPPAEQSHASAEEPLGPLSSTIRRLVARAWDKIRGGLR